MDLQYLTKIQWENAADVAHHYNGRRRRLLHRPWGYRGPIFIFNPRSPRGSIEAYKGFYVRTTCQTQISYITWCVDKWQIKWLSINEYPHTTQPWPSTPLTGTLHPYWLPTSQSAPQRKQTVYFLSNQYSRLTTAIYIHHRYRIQNTLSDLIWDPPSSTCRTNANGQWNPRRAVENTSADYIDWPVSFHYGTWRNVVLMMA